MGLESIPISTRWLLDAVGETGRSAINSVYLVACPKTQSKGTGFLLKSGFLVTNWHVVDNCSAGEVIAISSSGRSYSFKRLIVERDKDLALLEPSTPLRGGLSVKHPAEVRIGMQVYTWGYPLGYDGPAPVLTMGWLSGFVSTEDPLVKHFVINAAFNPGNSGGPLLMAGEDTVIGVVVSKHAPISPWLLSIIEALQNQRSGLIYTATDPQGNKMVFTEAQLVAKVLLYFREMTQVVLGEAIAGNELIAFLEANGVAIE